MKRVFTLFLLLAIGLNMSSQNRLIKTYYDGEEKTKLKEAYYVGDDDSTMKHGDYQLFSVGGNLILSGKYDAGKKTGTWLEQSLMGLYESYGSYNNNESFTGVKFIYDGNDRLERIQYILNDEFNPNPFNYQTELISRLNTKIEKRKDESDIGICIELDRVVSKYEFYSSLDYQDEKFPVGEQLLLLQIDFLENSDITFNLKQRMTGIEEKISQIENSIYSQAFSSEISQLEDSLQAFIGSKKLTTKNEIAYEVLYLASSLEYLYNEIEIVDSIINDIYTDIFTQNLSDFPDFIKNQFNAINEQFIIYTKSSSVADRIQIGKNLIPQIEEASLAYNELLFIEEAISEKYSFLEEKYKNHYDTLYNTFFPELEKSYTKYKFSEKINDKLLIAKNLLEALYFLDSALILFIEFDEKIDKNFENIRNKYLSQFPAIYSYEIPKIEAQKVIYEKDNSPESKLFAGAKLVEELENLSANFETIKKYNKSLSDDFESLAAKYKQNYKKIYKAEIVPLSKQISQYEKISKLQLKLEIGETLYEKSIVLSENYSNISVQEDNIKSKLPAIKQLYKQKFPDIYKVGVKELEGSFKIFLKTYEIQNRINKGNQILSSIENYTLYFDTINYQIDTIKNRFSECESKYDEKFQEISKTELDENKDKYKLYNKISTISEKLKEGEKLIAKLDKMITLHETLNGIYQKVDLSYKSIDKNYLKDFSILHKSHVVPLRKTKKAYMQAGYVEEKIKIGNGLMIKLEILNEKYQVLKSLSNSIEDKNTKFVIKYKNDSQAKYIYKRGKKLYSTLFSAYEQETSIDKKAMLGEELENILENLNSASGQVLPMLNDKLKEARSIEEMKRIIKD